jgi:hypothetical protein
VAGRAGPLSKLLTNWSFCSSGCCVWLGKRIATFSPVAIQKSLTRLLLRTDSSDLAIVARSMRLGDYAGLEA